MTRMSGAAAVTAAAVIRISAQDLRQLLHDRRQSHDRQLLDRKQRRQSFARHRLAADAFEADGIAETLAQHLHQVGAEPVAGFLGRDQENPSPDIRRLRARAITPAARSRKGRRRRRPRSRPAARRQWCCRRRSAMPASCAAAAPSTVLGPIVGRSKRRSCPLFGAFTSTPRAGLGANAPFCAQPRHARQQAVGALDVLDRDHVTVDHDHGLTDIERTERAQHLAPPGDIGRRHFHRARRG